MFRRKRVSTVSLALMPVLLTVLLCGCGKIGQTAKPAQPPAEPGPTPVKNFLHADCLKTQMILDLRANPQGRDLSSQSP